MIRVENIHGMTGEKDAARYLIDREWPRGVVRAIPRKEKVGQPRVPLARTRWSPDLAPSPGLWKWFHHDPDKVSAFRSRYFRELQGKQGQWLAIAQESRKGDVVLLYHGKPTDRTPAHFLKAFLDLQSKTKRIPDPKRKKFTELPCQGISVPVEKAISRHGSKPLKKEMKFTPEQRLRLVQAEKRRIVR